MSRLHFKGGAWTNAEDEVMKAALAQYGLRDWERVASMLTKKTSTQCRERWENYLDPRLHIHEAWSLEEEEKLVEFQALFPHKWRLIAEQLTRRTPNHYIRPAWLCEQRYLELKDEQEYYIKEQQQQLKDVPGGAAGEKQSLESYMAERRRRRTARKTHEERAARADTVSGERFESEMVDMATSRLANQDQKKGLRKERQRQLAEAAFLAKLESNREGIESGTLSLRQARKMKKALEEDRQTSGLVDEIIESDDEDGELAQLQAHGSDSADEGDEEDEDRGRFKAVDMHADQQQAGLVKKQRVLMKDLTEQQRLIQQRQMSSGVDGDDDGDGDTASSGSSSRVRAALTGVNQELLKQLASAPTTLALQGRAAVLAAGSSGTSIAAATAAEAKAELTNSLADLFATLPSAARAAAPVPELPLPPHKRPREALPPVPEEEEVEEEKEAETGNRGDDGATGRATAAEVHRGGTPEEFFRTLNLPAPRKMPRAEVAEQVSSSSSSGATTTTTTATAAAAASTTGEHAPPSLAPAEAAIVSVAADVTDAEAAAYMNEARRWVAVECESVIAAAATGRTREEEEEEEPMTHAELSAARRLVEQELSASLPDGGGDDDSGSGRTAGVAHSSRPHSSAMVAAVRAFTEVGGADEYGAHVNVQHALHQLSQRVATQVREANATLAPLRQEWEQVMAVAMLGPQDGHVLRGYVRDDGGLKGMPVVGSSAGHELDDSGSVAAPPSVAAYVYERIVSQLQRAQLATRFTQELRDRELLKMRRDLDQVEHNLQQLQARERTLQDMYRQKRLQQA
ncbi:Myb-like DNA-binding domain containing protein [Novymonas esmeraldas]|uniref:Myb-like DNA-binding domain containing protein n=1 Tax=Novymonas esmeraldas TaxID=1808958 RepID=A0AAW0EWP6_9TRYP